MARLHYPALLIALVIPCMLYAQTATDTPQTLSFDKATLTLNQEFQEAPYWRPGATQTDAAITPLSDPSFSWAAGYIWNHPSPQMQVKLPSEKSYFPAWTSNGSGDVDPNGDMARQLGKTLSPLAWSPDRLELIARRMPPALAETVDAQDPKDYMSAAIVSFPYAQQYGVFAISAKLPKGHGIWPAFWLLPADKSWPPEIDVMEVVGHTPNKLYTTVHFTGAQGHVAHGHVTDLHVDLSADYHEYAVDWGPKTINWYFDRKLIFSQATPESLHKPCYILANLAVGKNPQGWASAPDKTTPFPATMEIAYIKVWQRQAYAQTQE